MLFRLKEMTEQYPMFNENSENAWKFNREMDNAIKRSAGADKDGKWYSVDRMTPHVLSDICITVREKTLPRLKRCHHTGLKRQFSL